MFDNLRFSYDKAFSYHKMVGTIDGHFFSRRIYDIGTGKPYILISNEKYYLMLVRKESLEMLIEDLR
ncbi:MAG: hypothetical protein ABSG90_11430 [Dehalococcoidia bacterium]|jgi:hypothetical protein